MFTRKYSVFTGNKSIGYSGDGFLSAYVLGKEIPARCPLCFTRLRWLNWYEAKENDADLWAKCEKGHTTPEDYIILMLSQDDVQQIVKEANNG